MVDFSMFFNFFRVAALKKMNAPEKVRLFSSQS